jgi:ribosomal protein S18 acetylase RimI-like enzyme
MRSQLAAIRHEKGIRLTQVEYTQLAAYQGQILVEHDVTFDLYHQIHQRAGTVSSRWDWWRWQRFERTAVKRYRRVVVMSDKDRQLLGATHAQVIANGVDLEHYEPSPEIEGRRMLFIGSFRHFPNIVAYRYLVEHIFPAAKSLVPDLELTVVTGPDPSLHWKNYVGTQEPPIPAGVRLLQFVPDVRPLYHEANLVVVPTLESAGTNIKVLEAMAMERAVISTASGCAGLGLEPGQTVWIAESPEEFAAGIHELLGDSARRYDIARAAREVARREFDWKRLGERQRALFRALVGPGVVVRTATSGDLEAIGRIQASAAGASQWAPECYLEGDCRVADLAGEVIGFLAGRRIVDEEYEILNLATAAEQRRKGVAKLLVQSVLHGYSGRCFLEVRQSNNAARALYERLGFKPIRTRPDYYNDPNESAIEMAFQSC